MKSIAEYDREIRELAEKSNKIAEEKFELTRDLTDKQREILSKKHHLQGERDALKREAKRNFNKGSFMNLILRWDDGTEFDTRDRKRLNDLKDFIFNKGLPTSYEVRG